MQQEQSDSLITDIRIDNVEKDLLIKTPKDEFAKSYEEILSLGGLSQNFKRSAKRKIEKAVSSVTGPQSTVGGTTQYDLYGRPIISDGNSFTGDEAQSKQIILIRAGYGLFDAVEPPYDQYQLAKIYELSAPNYAAINAKAANIVGLGYDLVPTLSVKQRLEDIESPEILQRARKKLARQKEELMEWLETRNDDETLTSILMKVFIDAEATGNGYIEIGRKNTW